MKAEQTAILCSERSKCVPVKCTRVSGNFSLMRSIITKCDRHRHSTIIGCRLYCHNYFINGWYCYLVVINMVTQTFKVYIFCVNYWFLQGGTAFAAYSCLFVSSEFLISASCWDYSNYHIGDQRRFRRACVSAQSRQSLRLLHTSSIKVDEGSDQTLDTYLLAMTAHARLKNAFAEDEKYDNLMRWLIYFHSVCFASFARFSVCVRHTFR